MLKFLRKNFPNGSVMIEPVRFNFSLVTIPNNRQGRRMLK